MIFKILLPILLISSLYADTFKYRLAANKGCVYHGFEVKDAPKKANIYSIAFCDTFTDDSEPIFVITKGIGVGEVFYKNEFSKEGNLYLGYLVGVGEASMRTYGTSRSDITFLHGVVLGGYERELYKGLIFSLGLAYNYYYTLSDKMSLSQSDRQEYRDKIKSYGQGSTTSHLEPYFLLGVKF